jgi:hypothetical protein
MERQISATESAKADLFKDTYVKKSYTKDENYRAYKLFSMMDIDGGGSISLRELSRVLMGEVVRFVSCSFEHPDSGILFGLDEESCVIISEIESDSVALRFPFLITRMRLFRINDFKIRQNDAKYLQKVYQELVKLGDDPVEMDFIEPLIVVNKFSCVLDIEVDKEIYSVTLPVGAFYNHKIFVDKIGKLMDETSPILNAIDIEFIEKKRQIVFSSKAYKFRLLFGTGPNFRRSCRYALGFSAEDLSYSYCHEGQPLLMDLHLGLSPEKMEILMVELFAQYDRDGSGEFEFEEFRDFYIKYLDNEESLQRLKAYATHRFRDIERERFVAAQQLERMNKHQRKEYLKMKEADVRREQREKYQTDSFVDAYGIRRRNFHHRTGTNASPPRPTSSELKKKMLLPASEEDLGFSETGTEFSEELSPNRGNKLLTEEEEKSEGNTLISKDLLKNNICDSAQPILNQLGSPISVDKDKLLVSSASSTLLSPKFPAEHRPDPLLEPIPLESKKKTSPKTKLKKVSSVVDASLPLSSVDTGNNKPEDDTISILTTKEDLKVFRNSKAKEKRQREKQKHELQMKRRKKILQQIYQANAELKRKEMTKVTEEEENMVSSTMMELHAKVKKELIESLSMKKTEYDFIQNFSLDWSHILTSPAVTVTPAIFGKSIKSDAIDVEEMPATKLHPAVRHYYMLKENHADIRETFNSEVISPVYFNTDFVRFPSRHSSSALAMISSIKGRRDEGIHYRADRGMKRIIAIPPEDILPKKLLAEQTKKVRFHEPESSTSKTGLLGRITINSIKVYGLPSLHLVEKNSPFVTVHCGSAYKSSTEIYSYAGSSCSWDDLNWIFRIHKKDSFTVTGYSGSTANHYCFGEFTITAEELLSLKVDEFSIITLPGLFFETDNEGRRRSNLREQNEEEEDGDEKKTKKNKKRKYNGKFEISIYLEKGQEWDWYIKEYAANKSHLVDMKHQISQFSRTCNPLDYDEDSIYYPFYVQIDRILVVDVRSIHWLHKNRLYIMLDSGINEISTIDDNPILGNTVSSLDNSSEWNNLQWNFVIDKPELKLIFKVYSLNILIGRFVLTGRAIHDKMSKNLKEIEFYGDILDWKSDQQETTLASSIVKGKISIRCLVLSNPDKTKRLKEKRRHEREEKEAEFAVMDVSSVKMKHAKKEHQLIQLPALITFSELKIELSTSGSDSDNSEEDNDHRMKASNDRRKEILSHLEVMMSCCYSSYGKEFKSYRNSEVIKGLDWSFPVTKLMTFHLFLAWNRSKKASANLRSDILSTINKKTSDNSFSCRIKLHDEKSFIGYLTLYGLVSGEENPLKIAELLEQSERDLLAKKTLRSGNSHAIADNFGGKESNNFDNSLLLEQQTRYFDEQVAIPWKDVDTVNVITSFNEKKEYSSVKIVITEILLTDLKSKHYFKKNSPCVTILSDVQSKQGGGKSNNSHSTIIRENAGSEAIWTGLEMNLLIESSSYIRISVSSHSQLLGQCQFSFQKLFDSSADEIGGRELLGNLVLQSSKGGLLGSVYDEEAGKIKIKYYLTTKPVPHVDFSTIPTRSPSSMEYPILTIIYNILVLNLKSVHRFSKNSPYIKLARMSSKQNDVLLTTPLNHAGSYGKWSNLFWEVILDNPEMVVYCQVISESIVIGSVRIDATQLIACAPNKLGLSEINCQLLGMDNISHVGELRIFFALEPHVEVEEESVDEESQTSLSMKHLRAPSLDVALNSTQTSADGDGRWILLDEITVILNQSLSVESVKFFAGCNIQLICGKLVFGMELYSTTNEYVLNNKNISLSSSLFVTSNSPLILNFLDDINEGLLGQCVVPLSLVLLSSESKEGKIIIDTDIISPESNKLQGLLLLSLSIPELVQSSAVLEEDCSILTEGDQGRLYSPSVSVVPRRTEDYVISSSMRDQVIRVDNPFWIRINRIIINNLTPLATGTNVSDKFYENDTDNLNDLLLLLLYDNHEKRMAPTNRAGWKVIEWSDLSSYSLVFYVTNSVDSWEFSIINETSYVGRVIITVNDWQEKCRKSKPLTGVIDNKKGNNNYELFAKIEKETGEVVGKMVIYFTKNKLFQTSILNNPKYHHIRNHPRSRLLEQNINAVNVNIEDDVRALGHLRVKYLAVNNLVQIYDLFPNSPKVIFCCGNFEHHTDIAFNAGSDHIWDNLGWGRIPIFPNAVLSIRVMSNNQLIGLTVLSHSEFIDLMVNAKSVITLNRNLYDGQIFKGNVELSFYGVIHLPTDEEEDELDVLPAYLRYEKEEKERNRKEEEELLEEVNSVYSSVLSNDRSHSNYHDEESTDFRSTSTWSVDEEDGEDDSSLPITVDDEPDQHLSSSTPTPLQTELTFVGISVSELKKADSVYLNSPEVVVTCGNWKQETSRILYAGSKACWMLGKQYQNEEGKGELGNIGWKLTVKGSPFVRISVISNRKLIGSSHFMLRELLSLDKDEIGLIHSIHRLEGIDSSFAGFVELSFKVGTVVLSSPIAAMVPDKTLIDDIHDVEEEEVGSVKEKVLSLNYLNEDDETPVEPHHSVFSEIPAHVYEFPLMCKVVSVIFDNIRTQSWLKDSSLSLEIRNEFASKTTSLKVSRKGKNLVKIDGIAWKYRFVSMSNCLEVEIYSNGKSISVILLTVEEIVNMEKTAQGYLEIMKFINDDFPNEGSIKICLFISSLLSSAGDAITSPGRSLVIKEKDESSSVNLVRSQLVPFIDKKFAENVLLTMQLKLITAEEISRMYYNCTVSIVSNEYGKFTSPIIPNKSGVLIFDCLCPDAPIPAMKLNERSVVKIIIEENSSSTLLGSAIFTINDFLSSPVDENNNLSVLYSELSIGITRTGKLSFAFERFEGNVELNSSNSILFTLKQKKPRPTVINPDGSNQIIALPNISHNSNISVIGVEVSDLKPIHSSNRKNSPMISLEYYGTKFQSQSIPSAGDYGLFDNLLWNFKVREKATLKFRVSSASVIIGIVYIPCTELYSLVPDQYGEVEIVKDIRKDITKENIFVVKREGKDGSGHLNDNSYAKSEVMHGKARFLIRHLSWQFKPKLTAMMIPSSEKNKPGFQTEDLQQASQISNTLTIEEQILQNNIEQFKKLGIEKHINRFGDSLSLVESNTSAIEKEGTINTTTIKEEEENEVNGDGDDASSFCTASNAPDDDDNATAYSSRSRPSQIQQNSSYVGETNSYVETSPVYDSSIVIPPSVPVGRPKTSRGPSDTANDFSASSPLLLRKPLNEPVPSQDVQYLSKTQSVTSSLYSQNDATSISATPNSSNDIRQSQPQFSSVLPSIIENLSHVEQAEGNSYLGASPSSTDQTSSSSENIPHVNGNHLQASGSSEWKVSPAHLSFVVQKVPSCHFLSYEKLCLLHSYRFVSSVVSKVITSFVAMETGMDYNPNSLTSYDTPLPLLDSSRFISRKRVLFLTAVQYVEELFEFVETKVSTRLQRKSEKKKDVVVLSKEKEEIKEFDEPKRLPLTSSTKRKGIMMFNEKKTEIQRNQEAEARLRERQKGQKKQPFLKLEKAMINGIEQFIPQRAKLTVLDILGIDISGIDRRILPSRPYLTACKPYGNWSGETNPIKMDLTSKDDTLFQLNYYNVSVRYKWESCLLRRGQEIIFNLHDANSGLLFAKCIFPYEKLYKYPIEEPSYNITTNSSIGGGSEGSVILQKKKEEEGNKYEFISTAFLNFAIANEYGGGSIGGVIRFHIDLTVNQYQFEQHDDNHWNQHRSHHWTIYPLPPITYGVIRQKYHDLALEYDNQELIHPSLFGMKLRYRGHDKDESKFISPIFHNYNLAKKVLFKGDPTNQKGSSSAAIAKQNLLLKKSKPNPWRWDPSDKQRGTCIVCGNGVTGCPRCFMMPVREDGGFFYPAEFAYDPERERKQFMEMEKKLIELNILKARQLQKIEATEKLLKDQKEKGIFSDGSISKKGTISKKSSKSERRRSSRRNSRRNSRRSSKSSSMSSRMSESEKSGTDGEEDDDENDESTRTGDEESGFTTEVTDLNSLEELREEVIITYERNSQKIAKSMQSLSSKHSKHSRPSRTSLSISSETLVTKQSSTKHGGSLPIAEEEEGEEEENAYEEDESVTALLTDPSLDPSAVAAKKMPPFHTNLTSINGIRQFRLNIQPVFNVYIKVMPTGYIKRLTCTAWDTIFQLYHMFNSHSSYGNATQTSMILLPLATGLLEFHPELSFHTDLQIADKRGYDTLADFKCHERNASYVFLFIQHYHKEDPKYNNVLKLLDVYFQKNTLYSFQQEGKKELGIYTGNDKLPDKISEDTVQQYLLKIIQFEYANQQKDLLSYYISLGKEYKKNYFLKENREKYYSSLKDTFFEKEKFKDELRLKSQLKQLERKEMSANPLNNSTKNIISKQNKVLLKRQLSKKKSRLFMQVDEIDQQQQQRQPTGRSEVSPLLPQQIQQYYQQKQLLKEERNRRRVGGGGGRLDDGDDNDNLSVSDIILAEENRYQQDRENEQFYRMKREEKQFERLKLLSHNDINLDGLIDQFVEEDMTEDGQNEEEGDENGLEDDMVSALDEFEEAQPLDYENEREIAERRSIDRTNSSSVYPPSSNIPDGIPLLISSRSELSLSSLHTSLTSRSYGDDRSTLDDERSQQRSSVNDDGSSMFSSSSAYYTPSYASYSSASSYSGSRYYSDESSVIHSILSSYTAATRETSSSTASVSSRSVATSSVVSDWLSSTASYFTASEPQNDRRRKSSASSVSSLQSIDHISLQSDGNESENSSLFSGYRRSQSRHAKHQQQSATQNRVVASSAPKKQPFIHPSNTITKTLEVDDVYSHRNEKEKEDSLAKRRFHLSSSTFSSESSSYYSDDVDSVASSLMTSKSLTSLELKEKQKKAARKESIEDVDDDLISRPSSGGLFTYRSNVSSSHPSDATLSTFGSAQSLLSLQSYLTAQTNQTEVSIKSLKTSITKTSSVSHESRSTRNDGTIRSYTSRSRYLQQDQNEDEESASQNSGFPSLPTINQHQYSTESHETGEDYLSDDTRHTKQSSSVFSKGESSTFQSVAPTLLDGLKSSILEYSLDTKFKDYDGFSDSRSSILHSQQLHSRSSKEYDQDNGSSKDQSYFSASELPSVSPSVKGQLNSSLLEYGGLSSKGRSFRENDDSKSIHSYEDIGDDNFDEESFQPQDSQSYISGITFHSSIVEHDENDNIPARKMNRK